MNKTFRYLFGIESRHIKRNCILVPFLTAQMLEDFQVRNYKRARLYGIGNSPFFTFIVTGMGAGFVGDAVLYLADAGCKNIFLFGSCGLVSEEIKYLSIADLVSPFRCYGYEGFSDLLLRHHIKPGLFFAHRWLLKKFLEFSNNKVKRVNCATVASLKLEEELIGTFNRKAIDVLDMECSAFFSAAAHTGLRAISLFYISDVVKDKPFYRKESLQERIKLNNSIKEGAYILCNFIKENLTD